MAEDLGVVGHVASRRLRLLVHAADVAASLGDGNAVDERHGCAPACSPWRTSVLNSAGHRNTFPASASRRGGGRSPEASRTRTGASASGPSAASFEPALPCASA